MNKLKPVYVTSERGVSNRESSSVITGIKKVIEVAGVELKVKNFGNWSNQKVRVEKELKPRQSTDWYIQQGRNASRRINQLKADIILNKFGFHPWHEVNHYDVLITKTDLYKDQTTRFIIGIAQKNVGTVISTHRFRSLDSNKKRECLITETMHELGHVFGLPSNESPYTTDSLGSHCTNICIMRQGLNVPNDWVDMSRDRQKQGAFCERCRQDLKNFFIS